MKNHIIIDTRKITFIPGQSIMEAASAAGIYIPHLCHNPEFKPHGSCKLCNVKVNGRFMAACTTPAADASVIENNTEELNNERRKLLQMLFVEGNHMCPACERSGACQLQAVAYYTKMLAPEFTHFFPKNQVDASHPDFAIDFNRCILCELCVRASRDIDKKNVFAITGRGNQSRLIINSASGTLKDSDFSKDDKAAEVCPVGAILPKHKAYEVPIGERLYDKKPINIIGDISEHKGEF